MAQKTRPSTSSTHHQSESPAASFFQPPRPALDSYARKAIMFSGPDGLRPCRKTIPDAQYVGNGDRSQEITSNLGYLFNGPKSAPFPKAKNGRIGETGWEICNLKGKC